jgi:ribosomal protein L13E
MRHDRDDDDDFGFVTLEQAMRAMCESIRKIHEMEAEEKKEAARARATSAARHPGVREEPPGIREERTGRGYASGELAAADEFGEMAAAAYHAAPPERFAKPMR